LDLEVDRVKRDFARAQGEVEELRQEVEEKIRAVRKSELEVATLVSRDLSLRYDLFRC